MLSAPYCSTWASPGKLLEVQMPCVYPRTIKSGRQGGRSQASAVCNNPQLILQHGEVENHCPQRQSLGSLETWWGKLRHCLPFRWKTLSQDPFPKALSLVNLPTTRTSETNRNVFLLSVFGYQLLHNVSSNIFLITSWRLSCNSSISLKGKLKNFATNWEDVFTFFWMTRYWVDSYKMKKRKNS